MLINLSNKAESYELGQVSEDDAMKLTSISFETYRQIEGLSWINHQSKFSFFIFPYLKMLVSWKRTGNSKVGGDGIPSSK